MSTGVKWLDAAALDELPRNADCLDDDQYDALRAQARAALALRDELAEDEALRNRMGDILTLTVNALKGEPDPRSLHDWATLPEVARTLVNELAECRALVQLHMDDSAVNAREADDLRAKLVQAEQERDEAQQAATFGTPLIVDGYKQQLATAEQDRSLGWKENDLTKQDLAAAQAESVRLREALYEASTFIAVECDASSEAFQNAESLLAMPTGSRAALREMLTKAVDAAWEGGMGWPLVVGEFSSVPRRAAIVARLLGEEGGQS